ncbi:MAG: ABC transporter substrate-binding protein [Acidisphaera sp.]|nr:ABC transporter substrate-binding protein [Acidisphaera sp.]MBV9811620.1 ABC transporter substrate-binding protein [Acetobacteraceae bacterium]
MPRIVAAAFAAALLAGTAHAAPKDSVTLGEQLEPPILDPTGNAAAAIRTVVYHNLFESLTRIDENGQVVPGLAESWKVSPDGRTYTFKLRQNVRFHDGAPFDCSVVKFSYDRAVAPDSTNAQKPLFAAIDNTACPDPATAVVTLTHPSAAFLFNMGWADAAMISPKTAATNKTNPVGTGPFRFKSWARGDRIDLTRNPDYWGPKPALSAVTFRFIADPSAATAAMMAGDIDAYTNFPAPEAIDQFRADKRFAVVIGTTEGKVIVSLNEARKPLDDVRVRRALMEAIDRKQVIDGAMSGYGQPIGSHYIPTDPAYVDLTAAYATDQAKARKDLADAGAANATFTMMLPPPSYARRSGEVIAAMLGQVGVTVKLVPIEWAQWLDQVFKRYDYDMTIVAHVEPRDLDIYARPAYYFNYKSDDYKQLYARYIASVDPAEQNALLGDLQRKLSADEPNLFLFALPKLGVWNAKLHGLWTNSPIPSEDVTGVSWAE